VTRLDIELIRGVNSDGVVTHLLEKNLIKIAGRKDVPGKPFLYGTTKEFLEYFGLRSLADLPKLEEFASLEDKATENIKAFQGISEEFKQQAAESSPTQKEDDPSALATKSLPEQELDPTPEDLVQDKTEQDTVILEQEASSQVAPAANEGGNDEHSQAA